MKCPNCNSEVSKYDVTCSFCGEKLPNPLTPEENSFLTQLRAAQKTPPTKSFPPKANTKTKIDFKNYNKASKYDVTYSASLILKGGLGIGLIFLAILS